MRTPRLADHLVAIFRALEKAGIRWYVFGAQAVIAAGVVRFTGDTDITTEDVPVRTLERALRSAGFVLRPEYEELRDEIESQRILPLEHEKTGLQLDAVRGGPGFEEAMLSRAIVRNVAGRKIPYIETNDLLAVKVLAGREKDLEDVRAF